MPENPLVVVAAQLAVSFALAYLCESMTEYLFGTPFDKIEGLKPFKWALMYASAVAGVGLAFYYQLDLISLIGQTLVAAGDPTPVGMLLTGLGLGRGASFVHQFVAQYFPSKG